MYKLNESERERYARHLSLDGIGETGQERLRESSVLVVGLGGLGCPVCLYLSGAGVGRIGLVDADRVSLSNLQRQTLYSEDLVGELKVEAAAKRIRGLNSSISIDLYPERLTTENADTIVERYDLVIDCTDNWAARYLLDETCHRNGKPWVFGSIGGWLGMASFMNGKAGMRLTTLFPERKELEGRGAATAGVIGAMPGITGAVEASAAIQWLARGECALDGKLWTIDTFTFDTQTLEF